MINQVRNVKVDLAMAQMFVSLAKAPQQGVEDTNRKWSPDVVNDYAVDMLRGAWRETHQGMAFTGYLKDDTAVFVDGEQRCRAIIQAATLGAKAGDDILPPNPDIAFYFMVSEGLTQADVEAMDIGKRRTPADFVQMKGWSNKIIVASVARLCFLYENVPWSRDAWRKYPVSPSMIRQYLKENPGVADAVVHGLHLGKMLNASSASAGWHLAVKSGVEEKVMEEFFDYLHSGANVDKGDPILLLRDLLLNAKAKHRRYNREEQLALLIKTFNRWVRKERNSLLMFRTKGDDPEPFPRFK